MLMPLARNRLIPRWNTRPRKAPPTVVSFHIGVTRRSTTSLFGFFSRSASACSTLWVADDGTIEQYQDSMQRSAADVNGGYRIISVETAGGLGDDIDKPWSPAQVRSLAEIIAWAHLKYGIPLVLMKTSKSSESGIAYHRLGVPRSKYVSASAPGWLVPGGEKWSTAVGKVCPGQARIDQIPQIIELARQIVSGKSPTTPAPALPAPSPAPQPSAKKNAAAKRTYDNGEVTKIQTILRAGGYYTGLIDDDYGKMTADAVKSYQRSQLYAPDARHRSGRILADGDWGPTMWAHTRWVEQLQETLNWWKSDYEPLRVDGDYRSITQRRVYEAQKRNLGSAASPGAYWRAGGRVADNIPGPATCKMLGIPTHPGLKL